MTIVSSASAANPLRTETTGSRRGWYPAADGLRAIGAFAVLFTHVGFHSGDSLRGFAAPLLSRLDVGVAIFFALSGFLLFAPHISDAGRSAPPVRVYAERRVLRILPAALLAILAAAVLLPVNDGVGNQTWLHSVTFTQIYQPGHLAAGLTHLWSLATEVAFYAALPILVVVALGRRRNRARIPWRRLATVLVVLAAISPVYLVAIHRDGDAGVMTMWLPAFLSWFAVGMLVAALANASDGTRAGRLRAALSDTASAPGALLTAVALLMLLAGTAIAGPRDLSPATTFEALTKHSLYAAIAGLLLVIAVFAPRTGRAFAFLASRPMQKLGEISYGVFLYHLVVLELTRRAIGHEAFGGQFGVLAVLTIAVTLVIAWASYRWLERPIMTWGRQRQARRRRARSADPTASAR